MARPPRRSQARKTGVASERAAGRSTIARSDADQAGLFDVPLPSWIKPCLPTLVDKPPEGAKWVHEIKWDGYRVSVYVAYGK